MHDICTIHIRLNSVHGNPKLLMMKWLGLSVTVRVRDRVTDREWMFNSFLSYKVMNTFVFPPGLV